MIIDIVNGNVIVGDGQTILENACVRIQNYAIAEIFEFPYIPNDDDSDLVIDANGGYVLPGVINHHTHRTTLGPNVFGEKALAMERVIRFLDRHLCQGTTSVLCVDGFNSVHEAELINKLHPINIKMCTKHTTSNFQHAEMQGQSALLEIHKAAKIEEMIKLGAVAIGEVGAPGSPYGMTFIRRRIGGELNFERCRGFKAAIFLDPEGYKLGGRTTEEIRAALDRAGFADLSVDDALSTAHDMVKSFETAMLGLDEAVASSIKFNMPVICHNSPENKEYVVKAAEKLGPKLIASHSNHMFEVNEAVKQARKLKSYGSLVDVYSGDAFGARQMTRSPEVTFALLQEGLVDLMSTDFIAGYWDSILLVLEKAVEQGIITLPKAVSLATSNVAKAIPKLAPNRGLVKRGKVADLVITKAGSLSKITTVLISGIPVVQEGLPNYGLSRGIV